METTMPKLNVAGTTRFPASDEYIALVLLVDDQMMIAETVRRMVADQPDIDFHYCSEGEKALGVAEQIKPTVILQDLILPGVGGLTLVQQYRSNPVTKDIPVIVLSTTEDATTKSEAFKQGANDYLVKLPAPIELLARIRYHSKAYLNQVQRDEAYIALRESQQRLVEANFELQRLSIVDGLTGLYNRRYCDQYLATEWRRAVREKIPLSVLMIDVDEFKNYNDAYGHLAGDGVLKEIAASIKQCFARPADLVARFGGEEFIAILPNTALAGAQHLAEKVRHTVEDLRIPNRVSAVAEHVTVCVGVASTIPQLDDSFTALIGAADAAMYEAKKTGRNRISTPPTAARA